MWLTAKRIYSITAYRWIFILLLFSAIASSVVVPVLAIFATEILGASKLDVTTYFAFNALAGVFVVLLIGKLSDSLSSRRTLIFGGFIWLGVGYALLASSNVFLQMRLIGILFFSVLEIGNSQLFALAKDVTDESADNQAVASTTSVLRMAYSLGWVAGPAVGGFLLLYLDAREIFMISTFLYFLCSIASLLFLPRIRAANSSQNTAYRNIRKLFHREQTPLLIFSIAIVFLLSGDVLRVAFLPIFLEENLQAQPNVLGAAFSISPLLQVVLMPVVGLLADRFGSGKMVLSGAVAGMTYYLCLAYSTAIWHVYLLQGLYAFVVASVVGVGIGHAQILGHGEAGLATSSYFSAKLVAVVLGSLLSGFVAERYGVRSSFIVPAVLCAIGFWFVTRVLETKPRTSSEIRSLS